MAADPFDLDGHRSPQGQMATASRREAQRHCADDRSDHADGDTELHAQMRAGPADSWAEVGAKFEFLLGRFALTAGGQDEQIRKLSLRALSDIARLAKREERNR